MKKGAFIKSFLYAAIILSAFYAVSQSQQIIDWWRLKDYIASAEIEALATNSSMNELGRRIFYVYDPQLLDKSSFAESCTVGEETIVLGCYVSNQSIFVFDVQDERLEGIEEVTAAHEMLHAAYDRLSSSEQDELNSALDTFYKTLNNSRITENINSYRDRDESIVYDELHSIIGTEVRDLPSFLSEHYGKYFDDRSKVVELSELYVDEFDTRQKEIQAYDDQLLVLQGDIARLEADLSLQSQSLLAEKQLIENLRSDPALFNNAVEAYNNKVGTYRSNASSLGSLIEEFNLIVAARNKIALEERELVGAIDTRVDAKVDVLY